MRQHPPAIELARAEGRYPAHPVVVPRSAVEQGGHEALPVALALVVLLEDRVRCGRYETAPVRSIARHRINPPSNHARARAIASAEAPRSGGMTFSSTREHARSLAPGARHGSGLGPGNARRAVHETTRPCFLEARARRASGRGSPRFSLTSGYS